MKKIKIDFVDFDGINKLDNLFTRLLQKKFEVEISDRPDLLFFSESGHLNRLYTCKKIFFTSESILPDWSKADYAITCHHIENSRHYRLPYYVWRMGGDPSKLIRATSERSSFDRKNFCSTVISNANPRRTRERISFFEKLDAVQKVDSGGGYKNNVGRISPGFLNKIDFISNYRFNLCYENKVVDGYTTEKLTDAMVARCIPIYWGNLLVGDEFNKKSFLYRNDYPDDQSFIQKILKVNSSRSEFDEIFYQPYFSENTANNYFDMSQMLYFLEVVIDDNRPPVSHRSRLINFGRWKLAKRQNFY